jgi:hypothetical protein
MSNNRYNTPDSAIDTIVYGDLLYDDKSKITCADPIIGYFFATGIINQFFAMKPPKNSSEQTINELLFLERVTANANEQEIEFATNAEISEKKLYSEFCKTVLNLNFGESVFTKIFKQTDPILMLLKNHHNRPRPYQLAPYFNIQIRFSVPTDAFHPAYPSGHAFDSYIVSSILKSIRPNFAEEIDNFCQRMANSRFVAGVHYPSDNVISKKLADTIISHNLIKLPKKI